MSDRDKPFTVSDRRHFTPDGQPRDEPARPGEAPDGRGEARSPRKAGGSPEVPDGPRPRGFRGLRPVACRAGLGAALGRRAARGGDARGGARGRALDHRHPGDAQGQDRGAAHRGRGRGPRGPALRAAHGVRGEGQSERGVRRALAASVLLLLAVPSPAARPEKVIDMRGATPLGTTFEALWTSYLKAERAGDAENARRTFAGDPPAPDRAQRAEPRDAGAGPRRAGAGAAPEGRARTRRVGLSERDRAGPEPARRPPRPGPDRRQAGSARARPRHRRHRRRRARPARHPARRPVHLDPARARAAPGVASRRRRSSPSRWSSATAASCATTSWNRWARRGAGRCLSLSGWCCSSCPWPASRGTAGCPCGGWPCSSCT